MGDAHVLTAGRARALFVTARVARLATVRPDGAPHVVPIVFAVVPAGGAGTGTDAGIPTGAGSGTDLVVSAVDHKPKRTTALRRLANIAHEPRVSLLADHYDEDWRRLWWVRVDGTAAVWPADGPEGRAAVDRLVARYPQYATRRPDGPVIAVAVTTWAGWSAASP